MVFRKHLELNIHSFYDSLVYLEIQWSDNANSVNSIFVYECILENHTKNAAAVERTTFSVLKVTLKYDEVQFKCLQL